jgi:hypothetical protein
MFPGKALWIEVPIARAFLYILLRDPSEGALQIVTCLSKSSAKEPLFTFPQ